MASRRKKPLALDTAELEVWSWPTQDLETGPALFCGKQSFPWAICKPKAARSLISLMPALRG